MSVSKLVKFIPVALSLWLASCVTTKQQVYDSFIPIHCTQTKVEQDPKIH